VLLQAGGNLARSQALPPEPERISQPAPNELRASGTTNWLVGPYRAPFVKPSGAGNSGFVSHLLRNGTLSLTLEDAIDLAIENNFDVELQRYDIEFADTEIMRAKGGGLLRGVPTTVAELPSGEGGPGEPLLTTVGGYSPVLQLPSSAADLATITETQSDLSVLSPTPFSTGSPIPQYDPTVSAQAGLAQQIYPQADPFSTGSNFASIHSLAESVGYQQGFSTGGLLNVTFNNNWLSEYSTRLNLNPFTTAFLNLTFTQPLLRGFGFGLNKRFIRMARNETHIADDVFQQQLISVVSDVIRLYWDLVSLKQDLAVKKESLDSAQRLYQDTKHELEQGTQAAVELTAAMANVASTKQAYINEQGMVLQQELLLKEVLTRRGISDPAVASANIEPITPTESPDQDAVEPLASLIERALKHRPDVALAEKQEENTKLTLKGSRNELLPDLSLVASMQNNGGVGSSNSSFIPNSVLGIAAPPAELVGGNGAALSQIFSRSFPGYSVGVQLNIPLRNRVAKADVTRDELQYRQTEARFAQLMSEVRLQVGNAYIALQQAKTSYSAALQARKLQQQTLEVERAKFEAGVATAYELIQYEANFAQAKSSEVTAIGVYSKAKAALQRAVGSILIDHNVNVEKAYRGQAEAKSGRDGRNVVTTGSQDVRP
jgi:outer membrane protein TolC